MINTESSNEEVKTLLLQALNKNTVSYSNVSNMASSLSNGMMNIEFDVPNKAIIFSCGNKTLRLYLKESPSFSGLYAINDIPITDFLTKIDVLEINKRIDNKADKDHTHDVRDLIGYYDASDDIFNLYQHKADEVHSHMISDIEGLSDASISWDYKMDLPSITTITLAQKEINGKLMNINVATSEDVNNLNDKLNSKADATHTHNINDITDLQTSLDEKLLITTFQEIHLALMKNINDWLNNKADKEHTHDTFTDISVNTINGLTFPNTSTTMLTDKAFAVIKKDTGLLEVGKYIDFHETGCFNDDYTIRFMVEGDKNTKWSQIIVSPGRDYNTACLLAGNLKQDNETRLKAVEANTTKKALVDLFYPVGSIYTSMINTSPSTLFGGTWKPIENKFMYCVPSNKQSNVSGGSTQISAKNLPSHSHNYASLIPPDNNAGNPNGAMDDSWSDQNSRRCYWRGLNPNKGLSVFTHGTGMYETKTTESTGNGTPYMPPYITVYAWYRTA